MVKSRGKTSGQEVVLNVLQAGGEITGGSVSLRTADSLTTSGGRILATRHLDIEAGGDVEIASLALSLNELRIVLNDKDSSKLDVLLASGSVVIDGLAVAIPGVPGGAGIVLTTTKQGGKVVVKATTEAGQDVTDALKFADRDVWTLPATDRGKVIEQRLAQTDYKDWFNVGQENKGYFPLVDFQKGDTLVSLKSVDTSGKTWMARMEDHIRDLSNSRASVDGKPATMVLDLRVQPGGAGAAAGLKEFGKINGVTVRITEVGR